MWRVKNKKKNTSKEKLSLQFRSVLPLISSKSEKIHHYRYCFNLKKESFASLYLKKNIEKILQVRTSVFMEDQ